MRIKIIGAGSRRLKNLFAGHGYVFDLHNIRINGVMRGCSGYIQNPKTGKTVYTMTEPVPVLWLEDKIMFRLAEDIVKSGDVSDIRYKNQWPKTGQYVQAICQELDAVKPLLKY